MPRSLRPLLLLLILAPLLALPARAAGPRGPALTAPGDIYLALGDSLATGAEAAANNDNLPGYPAFLHEQLRVIRPGITLENLGQTSGTGRASGGETSSSFLVPGGQLERAEAFIAARRAEGRLVSPVTLTIGGNDMVAVIQPGSTATVTATLELYRANLEQILSRLVTALTVDGVRTGDLLIATYYNPYPGLSGAVPPIFPLNANPDLEVPRFNQIIAEEAAERGITVVPVYEAFQGRQADLIFVRFPYDFTNLGQLEQNFDFHPRETGHRLIASQFFRTSGYGRVYLPAVVQ